MYLLYPLDSEITIPHVDTLGGNTISRSDLGAGAAAEPDILELIDGERL